MFPSCPRAGGRGVKKSKNSSQMKKSKKCVVLHVGTRQCWPKIKNCQNGPTENGQNRWPKQTQDQKKYGIILIFDKKTANIFSWLANLLCWRNFGWPNALSYNFSWKIFSIKKKNCQNYLLANQFFILAKKPQNAFFSKKIV